MGAKLDLKILVYDKTLEKYNYIKKSVKLKLLIFYNETGHT